MTTTTTKQTKDKKEKVPANPPKLTYSWLNNIATSLRRDIIKVPETGLNYIINKNLVKIDRYLKERDELFKNIREKYIVKDANGKQIYFAYYSDPKDPQYNQLKLDANGNFIEVAEKDRAKIPATTRYDILDPEYKKDIEAWENDIEFTFHKFPQAEVEELIKDGKFDTLDYTPLIGFLFDEFE